MGEEGDETQIEVVHWADGCRLRSSVELTLGAIFPC